MPSRNQDREPGVRRKGYTVLLAFLVFACLGGMPAILKAAHLKISTAPPTTSDGIKLLGAPQALQPVPLPLAARPVDPAGPTATFPQVSESQEAAAVAFEDNRLRTMLHDSFRTSQPTIVHYRHALPTLVLPMGTHYSFSGGVRVLIPGQSTYTASDLIRLGALRLLPDGGALLKDNVFVSSGARLDLSSSDVGAIYLDNTASGSASIVAWGGNLDFRGTRLHPMTVKGWDETRMTPATDTGTGRPYIREVAGAMTFEYARVSFLGFWSGRTGGVAWTGLSTHPSYGAAILTTFTGNTYGAFVTRGHGIRFSGDLFESNQLDGLHFHRGTVGSSATFSAAVRNGANGFHVDRATLRTFLQHDVSEHNATNGFLVDGRPLVISASASGAGVAPGQGTRILNSSASGNGRTGILIEGGNRTVLKGDEVCAKLTGIALRYNASNAILDANDVRCGSRTGIRVGPQAPGALVYGNAVSGARIAMLVISPGGSVEIDKSLITLSSVFGISVRGVNSIVHGKDNVISGIGFRAVDSRAEATAPALSGSNTANWAYARKGTVLTYLEFHPLAVFWLSVVFLVLTGCLWTRRRKAPAHPYSESTRWRGFDPEPEPVPIPIGASVGIKAEPVPFGAAPVGASVGSGLADSGLVGSGLAGSGLGGGQGDPALAGAQAGGGDLGHTSYLDRLDQLNQLDRLDHLGQLDHVDQPGQQLDHRGAGDTHVVGHGSAGERIVPPWSPGDNARPNGASPYSAPYEADAARTVRGPFEAALPDAGPLDGQRLEAGPRDGGPLGGRRREDARLDPAPLDVPRVRPGEGAPGGGRPRDARLEPGPLDVPRRDGPRRDGRSADGRRREDPWLEPGPLDVPRRDPSRRDGGSAGGRPRDDRWLEPGPLDVPRAPRVNGGPLNGGPLDGGPLDGGPLDGGRLDGGRPDRGRQDQTRRDDVLRDNGRRDDARSDNGRKDDGRRDSARRDSARRDSARRDNGRPDNGGRDLEPQDGRRLDDRRLDSQGPDAERFDPERFDPAGPDDDRPYSGQSDGHRQSSRHGRSEPIDSTKPLPQVGDRQ